MYGIVFSCLSAIAGAVSAILWVIASRAEVAAPEDSYGVGALLGGYLIGKNSKGDRIDLIETAQQQSVWNSRAASAAAAASIFAVLALIANGLRM